MPDKTKIVFASGHELEVGEQPGEVQDLLERHQTFTRLTTSRGTDVYVVADRVAYIEQVPEKQLAPDQPPGTPRFAAHRSSPAGPCTDPAAPAGASPDFAEPLERGGKESGLLQGPSGIPL